jgi:hypothetical protein
MQTYERLQRRTVHADALHINETDQRSWNVAT